MTKQSSDYIYWLGEKYPIIFDNFLESYLRNILKIDSRGYITTWYRGYYAKYEVKTGQLYLIDLEAYAMSKPYPYLDGKQPEEIVSDNWVKYSDLNQRLFGTGYLVIAKGYIGTGDQFLLHRYEKLIRFDFVKGKPKIFDLSKKALELRKAHINPKYSHVTNLERKATQKFTHEVLYDKHLTM